MKHLKHLLLTLLVTLVAIPTEAKPVKTSHLYMFGFSASFKDSVVYVTDIQDIEGAWIDSKTKFLQDRDQYSSQLKEYLANDLQQTGRVAIVFFATEKKKLEKQYLKLLKKYKTGYDVHYLNDGKFLFRAIDRSEEQ